MEPMTIGRLINALLDIPADRHHLPVLINTDQIYNMPAHYAGVYDADEPGSEDNPFIIECQEEV
jgi:hypothetical protein